MAKESHFLYLFYIFLGVSGSVILPVKFVLQDDFKIQPSDFELIFRISSGLWMVKFIVGFFINPVVNNIFYYKILLTGMLATNAIAWYFMSSWSAVEITEVRQVTGILFVVFSTLCVMDVATDGRMIKHTLNETESQKGNTQTYAWGFRSLGRLIGGIAVIILVHRDGLDGVSPHQFINGFVIVPFIYILLLWGGIEDDRYPPVQEQENQPFHSFCKICKMLLQNFKDNYKILFFVSLVFITPSSGSNMYLYLSESIEHHGLGFNTKILGFIGLIDAAACVLGAVLYKKFMKKVNLRILFSICIVLAGLVSAAQLFILLGTYKDYSVPPELFVISDDAIGSIIGQLIFLPMMILLAHTIPKGFETVIYSGFTSFENILSAASSFISAAMTNALGIKRDDDGAINFDNLWIMIIITSSVGLLPILFIKLIPNRITSYGELHVIGPGEDDDYEDGIEMVPSPRNRAQFTAPQPAEPLPEGADDII